MQKNYEMLYDLYIAQELTTREIAKLYGVNQTTISSWMKKFGIKARDKNEMTKRRRGKMSKAFSGKNNPMYVSGTKQMKGGYIGILIHNHPYSKDNYVYEHRLVMEDYLDRYLIPTEVVHHINGDKTDNRIENLELFKSQSEHAKWHNENDRERDHKGRMK